MLPCPRESAVISYPVQDCTKQAVFKTLKTVYKFAFSRISTKAHEISENYAIEGGEKEICRDENVKLCALFKTEDPENDTLTGGTSLSVNIWVCPPGGDSHVNRSGMPVAPLRVLNIRE